MLPEFFKPFGAKKEEAQRIHASTDRGGILELKVLKGGPVFLFRGERSAAQAKAATDSTKPDGIEFDLAATEQESGRIRLEPASGGFTVYAPSADTIGYLRWRCKDD